MVLKKHIQERDLIERQNGTKGLNGSIVTTEIIYFDENGDMHELGEDDEELKQKVENVINAAEEKSKHKIRNFFKSLLAKTNLLKDSSSLTIEEIQARLNSIPEEKADFMDKYSTEKSEEEKLRDEKQSKEVIKEKEDEERV